MIRVLLFLLALIGVASVAVFLADQPGGVALDWRGYHVETSLGVTLGVILATALVLGLAWSLIRLIFNLPSLIALASRARKRNKGLAALSRGMIAAGAGDARAARRAAAEATRHLGAQEPLALLLTAQAAQLAGDRAAAEASFVAMAGRDDTRLVGLRGLHNEAQRRGDAEAAHDFAARAHAIQPLNWAGAAVLTHRAGQADWRGALATVETNARAKTIDKASAERLRAVLLTAIARDLYETDPASALPLARDAAALAPDLVPAVALAGRLYARQGDLRKAAKLIESAWRLGPHPDLADAYVRARPGDAANDRLERARTLARLEREHPESAMVVARAAIDARDFGSARKAMAPLLESDARPTARACLIMAEIEEEDGGGQGLVREWLARGSRAPRDPAWVADDVISDRWEPASPVTGKLDAFVWMAPREQLSGPVEDWRPLPEPPREPEQLAAPVLEQGPEPAEAPPLALAAVAVEPAIALPAHDAAPAAPAAGVQPAAPAAMSRVVFPLAAAPDDPGPRKDRVRGAGFFS